ncbi:MAG: primosomal protein N' [Bacteroidales bacterium]|nr:primosomal protein N' [Bacteroidales bacterium]MBR0299731.1 primosomal protein N' [Bacteroidales bacterium]
MAAEMRYVEVLLPLKLKNTLTYRLLAGQEAGVGSWVRVPLRGHPVLGVVTQLRDSAPSGVNLSLIGTVDDVLDKPQADTREIGFWYALADYYLCTPGEVFRAACNAGLQRMMLQAETPRKKAKRLTKGADAGDGDFFARLHGLSDRQQAALEQIRSGFAARKPVLLHGATGSGKTEIYLHLAAEQLQKGRDVLYLVPEIAVSKQLEQRIRDVFGKRLLVFHSRTTIPQRYGVTDTLRRDPTPRIVLGTRSAVFLPFRELGLVIVDEEHDRSYKQDDTAPRYNGRDAALMLAAQRNGNILLGSATPSLESRYNVETRKFTRVALPQRYHGGEDPLVEIIDTAKDRRLGNLQGSFSRKLLKEIGATLESGRQVLVFRSRRAYAPVVQCEACGEAAMCPHCHVALSYHKFNNTLSCHYCGYHRSFTMRCPSCGEAALMERGAGTERIEEELREAFPDRRIERFDADTTRSKTAETQMIRDFAAGKIDILVGTQMITKGFDFERLALVAIVSADSLFAVQDFRSDERALQLLTQLMGRSGRRGERGKIVIQTFQPDHPVLQRLLDPAPQQDPATEMLAERKAFSYPPYVRMITLTVKDRYEGRVWNVCRLIKEAADAVGIGDIAGPTAPAIDKVAGEHIAQFWIKLPRNRALARTKQQLYERLDRIERDFKGHTAITIDVDPS